MSPTLSEQSTRLKPRVSTDGDAQLLSRPSIVVLWRLCKGASIVFGSRNLSRDRWSFDYSYDASSLIVHSFGCGVLPMVENFRAGGASRSEQRLGYFIWGWLFDDRSNRSLVDALLGRPWVAAILDWPK